LDWPEFNDLVASYWDEKRDSQLDIQTSVLPALSAIAAGGTVELVTPLCGAWSLLLLAARLFDDVQDEEGMCETGDPASRIQAMTFGLFAIGAAQSALSLLQTDAATKQSVLDAFGRTLALAARSQVTTLRSETPDLLLADYCKVIAGKTGIIFATGAWCGARLATDDESICRMLYDYGLNAGMMIQILDDRDDLIRQDLPVGALTLPLIYGLTRQDHPQSTELRSTLERLENNPRAITDTAVLLQEMGALTWCQQVAYHYQQRAIAALSSLPPSRSQPLISYVTRP
jgi:geranylgeranyl pyrophosphate synthase